jgi:diguanylate cyclase (GGDEF)-like protein
MPHSPDFLPSVFHAVLATGESFFRSDVTPQPISREASGVVRGLGAVPLIDTHGVTIGALCVFDLNPISFGGAVAEALKALGRGVEAPHGPAPVLSPAAAPRPSPAAASTLRSAPAPAPIQTTVPRPAPQPVEHVVPGPAPLISIPLLDRVGGDIAVAREMARLRREQHHLSVVLFDIDRTNPLDANDADSTDPEVSVSEAVMKAIRGTDLAIRWTPDSLLVVLPGLSITEARPVAERVRAALAASIRHRWAVAAGVAELQPNEPFDRVVARADEKVRVAREHGHNRVA